MSVYSVCSNALKRCNPKGIDLKRLFSLEAHVSACNEHLEIKSDKYEDKFPLVWLRDNCQCQTCFMESAKCRVINWNKFDLNAKIESVETKNNELINIQWSDKHFSTYDLNWLRERSFKKETQDEYLRNVYRIPRILWTKSEFSEVCKRHDFEGIMKNDLELYNWLYDLTRYGVALIENTPTELNKCRELANRVAFLKQTHYGEEYHVKARSGANNSAYRSSFLQFHVDLGYYDYTPGVNMLHCIRQAEDEGGDNILIDGFQIAETIRKDNPEIFKILSTVKVNWSDYGEEDGKEFWKLLRTPVICLDDEDNVVRVNHSIPQRDSYFTVDINDVKIWYEANRFFVDTLNKNASQFKTKPGDILTFDNTRLIHGRLGYEDKENNERLLVGIYLDWDEIYSKMRVLKHKLDTQ